MLDQLLHQELPHILDVMDVRGSFFTVAQLGKVAIFLSQFQIGTQQK